MKSPETPKSISSHIADLKRQISYIEAGVPVIQHAKDVTELGMGYYKKGSVEYRINEKERDIQSTQIGVLTVARVMFAEFVQIWEQHRLLSQYVDKEVRAEFERKQQEIIRRYDPIYRGVNKYLLGLKSNKSKYHGGVGDI